MTAEARRGERVVRLKGGDPFVFGRGGEEAEHLRAPASRSRSSTASPPASPRPTAVGVPLTHRDHAHGVIFVTGHARQTAARRGRSTGRRSPPPRRGG